MTTTIHKPELVYDPHENRQGRTRREQRYAQDMQAYEAALAQAEAERIEAQHQAQQDEDQAKALAEQIALQTFVNEARVTALQKFLSTTGTAFGDDLFAAREALDSAKRDGRVGVDKLFSLWIAVRRANARSIGTVSKARQMLAQLEGVQTTDPTDALEADSFREVVDDAVRLRTAAESSAGLSVVDQVIQQATEAAHKAWGASQSGKKK